MAEHQPVELLKALLRREVELFCRRLDPLWDEVAHIVDAIRRNRWQAVFFGGTLRSLLVERLFHGRAGRPRDVDLVLRGAPLPTLRELFGRLVSRETRFGGLHLRDAGWEFDIWPLERTWGIEQDRIAHPGFEHLPGTTFLNVEAAAIDVWPEPSGERQIYSGDDQFFRALLDRVVEVNREENPFPELCVVRSLVLTSELAFGLGPRLMRYIARHGSVLSRATLEAVQQKHYGLVRVPGEVLAGWIESVTRVVDSGAREQAVTFSAVGLVPANLADELPTYSILRAVERWHRRGEPPVVDRIDPQATSGPLSKCHSG
jgi:hypothetical protein